MSPASAQRALDASAARLNGPWTRAWSNPGVPPSLDPIAADVAILLRVALACVLAAAIGWEREYRGKAAGLRTHMLVGGGAVLFVSLTALLIRDFRFVSEDTQADPVRVIEAIVGGVSFLGAGTIFVSRGRHTVVGLTTAASIWITAAIGIAIALERYLLGVGTTVLVLAILRLLPALGIDVDKVDREEAEPARD